MTASYSDYCTKAENFANQLPTVLTFTKLSTVVDNDGNPVDSNGFSSNLATWAPDWTSAFYEDLCEGFEQEQRENFRQYRESKARDSFSTELCLLLKRYLVPLFDEMVENYYFKKAMLSCGVPFWAYPIVSCD